MRRVIYISRSRVGSDPEVLDAIVRDSSIRNAAVGITGILWAGKGQFVQALEGDDDEIESTLARIRSDVRHTDVEIVFEQRVHSRMFGKWAMIHSKSDRDSTFGTAFLIGFASRQNSPAAHRIVDLLIAAGS